MFKLFFHKIKIKHSSEISIECFYNNLSHNIKIKNFLYEKLKNIIEKEYTLKVFEINSNIINDDAVGTYFHIKNNVEYNLKYVEKLKHEYTNKIDESILDRLTTYPRIEISSLNENKLFTLAHELGHHLIELNDEIQSEELADKYVYYIFKKHFGDVYLGIFNTMLNVYSNYTIKNFKKHYIMHYLDFYTNYKDKFELELFK